MDDQPTDLDRLDAIRAELDTQDNRATSHPIFVVQERNRIYGFESGWEQGTEETTSGDGESLTLNYRDVWDCYRDVWDWVQPFLTCKAAEDYIAANRHNLIDPRIYVASAYRNEEWQLMQRVPALAAELRALRAETEADGIVRAAVVDALAEAGCEGAGVQEHVGDAIGQLRALRDEVQDWRDTATSAAGEGCGDEVHCTCVGPLRKTVADLHAENERLRVISASVDEVVDKLRLGVGEFGSEACSIFLALMEMHGLAKREQARGGA